MAVLATWRPYDHETRMWAIAELACAALVVAILVQWAIG